MSKYQEWKDLFQWKPDADPLENTRAGRGRDHVGYKVQRMSEAAAEKVNIDHYKIEILKFPTGKDSSSLFEHIRTNLSDFFDPSISTLDGYTTGDAEDWTKSGEAKLGCIMLFKIAVFGPIHEQAAVIVSKTESSSWVFSPVTIGLASPGEHPVSGNRHFGITTGGSSADVKATVFTRAADRAVNNSLPDYNTVYDGGHKLWVDFQNKVSSYVNSNGGQSRVVSPITHRPAWSDPDVQAVL